MPLLMPTMLVQETHDEPLMWVCNGDLWKILACKAMVVAATTTITTKNDNNIIENQKQQRKQPCLTKKTKHEHTQKHSGIDDASQSTSLFPNSCRLCCHKVTKKNKTHLRIDDVQHAKTSSSPTKMFQNPSTFCKAKNRCCASKIKKSSFEPCCT